MPEGSGFSACSQLKSRLTSLIASRYFRNFPTTCSSSDVKLCPTKAWIFFISNLPPHPHFEYPQFKQVAHPSMITTALVLHLRSEEHTSELQSLMRISYAVLCLKKKKVNNTQQLKN